MGLNLKNIQKLGNVRLRSQIQFITTKRNFQNGKIIKNFGNNKGGSIKKSEHEEVIRMTVPGGTRLRSDPRVVAQLINTRIIASGKDVAELFILAGAITLSFYFAYKYYKNTQFRNETLSELKQEFQAQPVLDVWKRPGVYFWGKNDSYLFYSKVDQTQEEINNVKDSDEKSKNNQKDLKNNKQNYELLIENDVIEKANKVKDENIVKIPTRVPYFDRKWLRDLAVENDYGAGVLDNGDVVAWGPKLSPFEQNSEGKFIPHIVLSGQDVKSVSLSNGSIYAIKKNGNKKQIIVIPVKWTPDEDNFNSKYIKPLKNNNSTINKIVSWVLRRNNGNNNESSTLKSFVFEIDSKLKKEQIDAIKTGDNHLLIRTNLGRVFSASTDTFGIKKQKGNYIESEGQFGVSEYPVYGKVPEAGKTIELKTLKGINIVEIGAGAHHSIVRSDDGRVWSFGSNKFGQLGYEYSTETAFVPVPVPVEFPKDDRTYIKNREEDDEDDSYNKKPKSLKDSNIGNNGMHKVFGQDDENNENIIKNKNKNKKSLADKYSEHAYGEFNIPTTRQIRVESIAAGGDTSYFVTRGVTIDSNTKKEMKSLNMLDERYCVWSCGQGQFGQHGNGLVSQVRGQVGKVKLVSDLSEWDDEVGGIVAMKVDRIIAGKQHAACILSPRTTSIDRKSNYRSVNRNGFTGNGEDWKNLIMLAKPVYFWGNNYSYQLGTGKRNNEKLPIQVNMLPSPMESRRCELAMKAIKNLNKHENYRIAANNSGMAVTIEELLDLYALNKMVLAPFQKVREVNSQGATRTVILGQQLVMGNETTAVYTGIRDD